MFSERSTLFQLLADLLVCLMTAWKNTSSLREKIQASLSKKFTHHLGCTL